MVSDQEKASSSPLKKESVKPSLSAPLNTESLKPRIGMSVHSSWRNRLEDIFRGLQALNWENPATYLVMGLKHLLHWELFWGRMSVYSFMLTSGAWTQMHYSTQSDSLWWAPFAAVFYSTTLLWFSAVVTRMMSGVRSTTSPPKSK